jgi:hypothetical protein
MAMTMEKIFPHRAAGRSLKWILVVIPQASTYLPHRTLEALESVMCCRKLAAAADDRSIDRHPIHPIVGSCGAP